MKIASTPMVAMRVGFTAALVLLSAIAPRGAAAGPHHFEEWVAGRITSVDAGKHALVLRADQRDTPETFRWDRDSRFWRPDGPKDGQSVETGALKVGDIVKIQFRKPNKREPAFIVKIVETALRN